MVGEVPRACRKCENRKPGCYQGCTERAVQKIVYVLMKSERQAAEQLKFDQFAMKQAHYMQKMSKNRRSRK